MKIDPVKHSAHLDSIRAINTVKTTKAAKTAHNDGAISDAAKRDAIKVSDATRLMPDLARRISGHEEVRDIVMKRYADFVDKPLDIKDQNILSALKRTLTT
jgi:hypothetical protein